MKMSAGSLIEMTLSKISSCFKYLVGLFTVVLFFSNTSFAQNVTPAKWGSHLDLEGKAGTKRNLGEVDLFVPLFQNNDTLLFTNIRGRMDDRSSSEGNFGLGLRHMTSSGWNIGGIAYLDRRKTKFDNYFSQTTLSLEALSMDWDLRANGYIPHGTRVHEVDSFNTAELSGTSVIFRGGEERSMSGYDAEVGWRAPFFAVDAAKQLRFFVGGYRFTGKGMPDISGPRLRTEMTFDDIPMLWKGARVSLGAEWQNDNPRGSQGFISARIHIPLQFSGKSKARLKPMERRMIDPVIRDIDIVSQAGTYGRAEIIQQTTDGQSLTVLNSNTTATTGELNTALAKADANTVILSGTFHTDDMITIPEGQTLIGAGNMTVQSSSGRTAVLTLSGATISTKNQGAVYALSMEDNTTLRGMKISISETGGSGRFAILAQNKNGIVIENSTITSFGGTGGGVGIDAMGSSNIVIKGNEITAISNTAGAIGIRAMAATNITIRNNNISTSTSSLRTVIAGSATTSFNAASSGNTADGGDCLFSGAPSGSVMFSTISCP